MKKKKEIPWANIGLAVGLGFAWTKLGFGAAVKEIGVPVMLNGREYPTMQETGYLTQAEWQTIYGGSQLDYEDWLKDQ